MTPFGVDLPDVCAPVAVLDRSVMRENFAALQTAADGVPLRIATKSIRVRGIIEWALRQDGVAGALVYSLAEALWLAEHGARDLVVAYPSVDVVNIRRLATDEVARSTVALMVDLPEHVQLIAETVRAVGGGPVRVAVDLDASLRVGRMVLGAHRSAVHTPEEADALGVLIERTDGVELVGAMVYEAQIAGVPDLSPAHRLMKKRSYAELSRRRRAAVAALSQHGDLEFVNGGGTGSVHLSGRDGVVTDLAVGSGLFTSTLFDNYRDLRTRPAAYFVSPVVRKPAPDVVVTFSGGYIASGPPSRSRVPTPVHPPGLSYFGPEGAGEVQTPLRGKSARGMELGDLVWFRHAKAGEMCERFDEVILVEDGEVVGTLPTYRGEGHNHG